MKDKQKSGSRHQERRARAAGYINELFACVEMEIEMGRGREGVEGAAGVGERLLFSLGILCASRIRTVTHTHRCSRR